MYIRPFRALLYCMVLFTGIGCTSDKSKQITESNKDSILDEIRASRAFTVEEVQLLTARRVRVGIASATGQTGPQWVGQTLQQIIDDERKLRDDEKAKQIEADRMAAEAKAKEDVLAAELRQTIALTVFDKGFIPSDAYNSRYQDYITVKCAYENKANKGVRAFRGSIRFTDLFDQEIAEITLTIDDPIAAGEKATWSGTIEYNQFTSWHQRLRNAEMKNMKVTWIPKGILFEDGSQLGAK